MTVREPLAGEGSTPSAAEGATTGRIGRIEVLGPGCTRCRETHRVVRHVVERAGLRLTVEKVESLDRMLELGVLSTPAVAIDGRIVLSGRIPSAEEIEKLLDLA